MIAIAKGIVANESARNAFVVQFVSEGGEFEQLIEAEGFPLKRIEPRITEAQIANIFAINDEEKFGTIYSKQEMIRKVEGDVAYLKELKPTAVITGSYISMPVACQVANVPLVWTIQSTWLKEFFVTGAGVTDNIPFGPLRAVASFLVFTAIRFWMWYGFINPVNKAARHFGVREYKPVFNYFCGALTLVAEPPEFSGIKLPTNHFYIGPLIANQEFPIPDEVKNIPRDKPLVYFAMGSSGVPRIVAQIIESFRGQPYRVIAPVKSLLASMPDLEIPPNVIVTDWLPALQVSKMADLSVIHGGIGTVMTAVLAGKPVVGVGMQPEQVANIACLVRKGIAIRVPRSRNLAKQLQAAIHVQLHNDEARRKAEAFSRVMEKWNGPKIAAELLYEKFGHLR